MAKLVSTNEAKTRLSKLLREVKAGSTFTITNKGEAIADLVPSSRRLFRSKLKAVEEMKTFIAESAPVKVDIKALINEGRF